MPVGRDDCLSEFAPSPESVRAARQFVRSRLEQLNVPEPPLDSAVLLTSELVTNAVLHARTEVTVRLVTEPSCVRIEVGDGNTRHPTAVSAPLDATSGRGLRMVQEVADNWGIDGSRDGKTIWFEMPIAVG